MFPMSNTLIPLTRYLTLPNSEENMGSTMERARREDAY